MKRIIMVLVCLLPLAASAETVYVREQGTADMRSGPLATDPVVKTVRSGNSLTVIERGEEAIHVRDDNGNEGWISSFRLTDEKPKSLLLLAAETKLKEANKELAKANKRIQKLEDELKKAQGELKTAQDAPEPVPAADSGAPEIAANRPGFRMDVLWILISFAMLVAGFAVGALWLRERTRRKLGGMHIRVN